MTTPFAPPAGVPARPGFAHYLRHALQVLAATTAIAGLLAALGSQFRISLVYAWGIGLSTWALIDFGRLLLPRTPAGWPRGAPGLALVVGGCVAGWFIGTAIGDAWWGLHTLRTLLAAPRSLIGDLAISAVAGTVISGWFYLRSAASEQAARSAAAERDATLARLGLLQSQLEPHMLFNTLANLRALIASDPARAQQMLDRLIDFLRATLAASRRASHPLADEFDRVADYLALMQVRMGARLATTLALPDELRGQAIPPLLLQPLVENAIRHGLEPQRGPGRLRVAAARDGDSLVLSVHDNGAGLAASRAAAGRPDADARSGFGLAQVRERLQTLFGATAALRLVDAPGGGTLAEIRLPARWSNPAERQATR